MKIYCEDCQVTLTRIEPEFHSRQDGWVKEHWFPSETYKCLRCESCNFFVQSHTKTWDELEAEAIATGRATQSIEEIQNYDSSN